MAKQRFDLGALFFWLSREAIAREEPILERHGLEMWDYAVLAALGRGPARNQMTLAATVRRDKTRLIGHLDRLEADGFIRRRPDPGDRRNQMVELTPTGQALLSACQKDIRAMESRFLAVLDRDERVMMVSFLERLVRDLDVAGGTPDAV